MPQSLQPPSQTHILTGLLWKRVVFISPPTPHTGPSCPDTHTSSTLTYLPLGCLFHGLHGLGWESEASPSLSSPGRGSYHQGGLCGPTVHGVEEASLWRPQLASYYIGFY